MTGPAASWSKSCAHLSAPHDRIPTVSICVIVEAPHGGGQELTTCIYV